MGSSTVNPVVVEAADLLRREEGLEIRVDAAGGSSGGLAALGDGRADVAMSSRPVSAEDHERFPETRFEPTVIALDAVALVVSRDVWDAGVRSISREQMRGIYEGRIRRWSELGGPDRRIAFFNKEPGRGTWEVFARWLYGVPDRAPLVSFPEVGSNEETRNKVASTRGAMSQLSASWADGERVFPLAISGEGGEAREEAVAPSREAIAAGRYPLSRQLLLVTDGEARGAARRLVDFLLSSPGQEIVRRHGYLASVEPPAEPAAEPPAGTTARGASAGGAAP